MFEDKDKKIGGFETNDTSVKFQEYRAKRYYPETPKIVQWVMKYFGGFIKDEKQANYVLLGFVVVAIVISLFLIFSGGSTKLPSEREILRDTPNTPIQ